MLAAFLIMHTQPKLSFSHRSSYAGHKTVHTKMKTKTNDFSVFMSCSNCFLFLLKIRRRRRKRRREERKPEKEEQNVRCQEQFIEYFTSNGMSLVCVVHLFSLVSSPSMICKLKMDTFIIALDHTVHTEIVSSHRSSSFIPFKTVSIHIGRLQCVDVDFCPSFSTRKLLCHRSNEFTSQ